MADGGKHRGREHASRARAGGDARSHGIALGVRAPVLPDLVDARPDVLVGVVLVARADRLDDPPLVHQHRRRVLELTLLELLDDPLAAKAAVRHLENVLLAAADEAVLTVDAGGGLEDAGVLGRLRALEVARQVAQQPVPLGVHAQARLAAKQLDDVRLARQHLPAERAQLGRELRDLDAALVVARDEPAAPARRARQRLQLEGQRVARGAPHLANVVMPAGLPRHKVEAGFHLAHRGVAGGGRDEPPHVAPVAIAAPGRRWLSHILRVGDAQVVQVVLRAWGLGGEVRRSGARALARRVGGCLQDALRRHPSKCVGPTGRAPSRRAEVWQRGRPDATVFRRESQPGVCVNPSTWVILGFRSGLYPP
eukprot:3814650-Prymnesium_polylepis.1